MRRFATQQGSVLHLGHVLREVSMFTTGVWASSGRVYTTEACAAPGHVYATGVSCTWVSLDYSTVACAAPEVVYTTVHLDVPTPQVLELHLDLAAQEEPVLHYRGVHPEGVIALACDAQKAVIDWYGAQWFRILGHLIRNIGYYPLIDSR